MPGSPSFPSDGRGKWRKRKRDTQINNRRSTKHHEDPEDDDDDPDNNDDEPYNDDLTDALPDPGPLHSELLSGPAIKFSDFPLVVRRSVDRPHSSVLAIARHHHNHNHNHNSPAPLSLENVSHGQLQALSAVPPDSPAFDLDSGTSSYVAAPPPILNGRGILKRFGTRYHVIPMHSDWFSPATVHRLERQVVPHFFSGKSLDHTPEKYMECRNYVVAKYMENPEKQLTASDFLGLIAGIESEDIQRVVRFLDHWGIINYCAPAPSREPWNVDSYLREESSGEIHVPEAALKSIDSLIKFDKPKCKLKAAEIYPSLMGHPSDDCDLDEIIRERLSENHCNYCSRALPTVYYQSSKEVDIMLCSDCFHEGRYVIGHSSLDFTVLDSSKDYGDPDGESWTDQETFLLLEAVEICNENWNEIAEHVGTKSKAQCILHFLRLPVEDGLLENIEVPGVPAASNLSNANGNMSRKPHFNSNGDSAGLLNEQEADFEIGFPFASSGNPVMALVAFLASSVGPRVAAACAHASLAVLSEDSDLSASQGQLQKQGSGHSNRVNLENMHSRDSSPHGEMANSHLKEENSAGYGSRVMLEAGSMPLSAEKVKSAAKAGLAAAAMKAKLFADHEEREIQRLSANIINHQLKRLELKLKQFAEVETFLMKECEQLERTRQRLFADRARFMATQQMGASGVVPTSMNPPAAGPSMVNNSSVNNRPQVMAASSSQPSISGYSNTNQPQPQSQPQPQQQAHPHMPFMPRQPMFGMGPRLPLSALQPSSSGSPNAMFNASGNTQPGLNRPMLRPLHGTGSGLG